MKAIKHILALCLSIVMISSMIIASGVFTASAIAGAGLQQTTFRSYGADISFWNVSSGSTNDYSLVDFAKMKADGCQYVILRIGYEARSSRQNTLDSAFVEYYKRGRAAGMPMGLYFYQLCDTYEEAVEDANWVMKVIEENNMYFEYPIYYDVEEMTYGDKPVNLGNAAMEQLCLGWCETLAAKGYFPGIYGGGWSVLDKLSDDFKSKYDLWYAAYPAAQNPHLTTDKSGYCGMWQYASEGYNYDGVPANAALDVNVCYKDYPAIMKKYGYNNCGDPELAAAKEKLQALCDKVKDISFKNYTEETLVALRAAYNEAVALLTSTSATKDQVNASYTKLDGLYKTTGKNANSNGVYINAVNTRVNNGMGVLFTPKFSEINADTANHIWTSNLVAKWDSTVNGYLVSEITTGDGPSNTPAVSLESDEIFIAVHDWETGVSSAELPVIGSAENVTNLWNGENEGYKLKLSGIDVNTGKIDIGAYVYYERIDSDGKSGNVAYNKPYTASGIYSDENGTVLYPDEGKSSMTDGISPATDADYSNSAFAGFNVGSEEYERDGYASITVDLGKNYSLNKFVAEVGSKLNEGSGIVAPKNVSFFVSQDNKNWTSVGTVTPVDDASVSTVLATLELQKSVQAKYVQYRFVGASNWIMISEVEAYGTEAVDTPDTPDTPVEPPVDVPGEDDEPEHKHTAGSAATCTEDQVCLDCGEVLVKAEGHVEGDWVENGDALELYCGVCGELLEVKLVDDEINALGDINESGEIDSMDYILLKRNYFGTYEFTEKQLKIGDINENGEIDSMDYILLKRAYFGTYEIK